MSRNKGRRSRGRGKRSCRKQRAPNNRRSCPKRAAYPHPLTAAMADLLGGLMQGGRRAARSGRTVLWTPALLCVCAVLMSWDPSPTLGERFEKAGLSLALLLPRRKAGGTYQGLIKALGRNGGTLHRKVADRLRERMRLECGRHWLREGWCAFAADGSKFNCPRTAANEKFFGCAGKAGKTQGLPQQFLTTLWHMGSGLPWAWESGVAKSSERAHLLSMLGLLPEAALLVADAGFVGYDLLKAIAGSKRFFLIRIGSNVALLRKLGLCAAQNDDTVYLWPQYDRRKPTRRQRNPPMPLRLIRLQRPGRKTVYLLSNVSEEEKLTVESARLLYELRWGVEVFFRSLKQTLQKRKLRSAAPAQATRELHWAVLGVWVLGLLGVRGVIASGKDPLSFSVALALRRVRHAAATHAAQCPDLPTQLARAVKDGYERAGPKTSRHWPRRKKSKPPGRPNIRLATRAEVQLAQEFHSQSAAA